MKYITTHLITYFLSYRKRKEGFIFSWYLNKDSSIQEESNEIPIVTVEHKVTGEETLKTTPVGL
jgi:hypothetical protein